jgi:hypothetical protein
MILKPYQDASFRTNERIMIKAHLFIKGISLKIDATTSIMCSDATQGWFKSALNSNCILHLEVV